MSVEASDVKLAIVAILEKNIAKSVTVINAVVNHFGAVNITSDEISAVLTSMQHSELLKNTGIAKSFLGLAHPADEVRKAIAAETPLAIPHAIPAPAASNENVPALAAPIPVPAAPVLVPAPEKVVNFARSSPMEEQAKTIVVDTLRERSVGRRTLVTKIMLQFGIGACPEETANKIINNLFAQGILVQGGGSQREFVRLAGQEAPTQLRPVARSLQAVRQQIETLPRQAKVSRQPSRQPIEPSKVTVAPRGRKPFAVDRKEVEQMMVNLLAERSVGRITLINKVMTHFGAASLEVSRAEGILDALMNAGTIEQAGGSERSLLALRQNKHASPVAEAVQKYVIKRGTVSMDRLRQFVAKQLDDTDPRRVHGTVTGSLRQLDPKTRKPLFYTDGNKVHFDPNHGNGGNHR